MLFQNIFSDASTVQDCLNIAKTRFRTKEIYALRPHAAYLNGPNNKLNKNKKRRKKIGIMHVISVVHGQIVLLRNKIVLSYPFLYLFFIFANCADPVEMLHYGTFHLGLQ